MTSTSIERMRSGNDAMSGRRTARLGVLLLTLLSSVFSVASTAEDAIVFDARELALLAAFGPWSRATPQDPGNALSGEDWAESLGESLFDDPDLSGSREIACSNCHVQALGFADGRRVASGAGQHVRNTQGLLDVARQHGFGWDGGADSLWAATLRPLLSPVEMAADIGTLATRLRARPEIMEALRLGGAIDDDRAIDDESLVVLAAKAIGAYLRTLTSPETPFDRFRNALLDGETMPRDGLSIAAQRGLKLFLGEANCHVCHYGSNFSNGEYHDTGRPFYTAIGEVDPGRYDGIRRVRADRYGLLGPFADTSTDRHAEEAARRVRSVTLGQVNFGQWRTPTLRNLRYTAPYQHDGSHATLREVVDAYADIDPERLHSDGEAILKPLALSDTQRDDLVAFLESLSARRR